jgi:hypothetical protein
MMMGTNLRERLMAESGAAEKDDGRGGIHEF